MRVDPHLDYALRPGQKEAEIVVAKIRKILADYGASIKLEWNDDDELEPIVRVAPRGRCRL